MRLIERGGFFISLFLLAPGEKVLDKPADESQEGDDRRHRHRWMIIYIYHYRSKDIRLDDNRDRDNPIVQIDWRGAGGRVSC